MKTILILASNPKGDLSIDREIRDLKAAIKRSKNSEQFNIEIELAVTTENLDELIYDNLPYIVHFCGHGAGDLGLIFENRVGVEQFLSNQALSDLFRNCSKGIKCVLLNACHTEVQADIIVEHIPYVIGTSREILDKAAYYFAVGFYKGLVRDQSIEASHQWGYNSIQRNMANVEIVLHPAKQFRKIEVIGKDGTKINPEPLRIILKHNEVLENNLPEIKSSAKISAELEQELNEIAEYILNTSLIVGAINTVIAVITVLIVYLFDALYFLEDVSIIFIIVWSTFGFVLGRIAAFKRIMVFNKFSWSWKTLISNNKYLGYSLIISIDNISDRS